MSMFSFAYADLTTDNQGYYAFDDSESPYSIFGATGTSDGMSFDGSNDYIQLNQNLINSNNLTLKFKADSTTSGQILFTNGIDSGSNANIVSAYILSGKLYYLVRDNTGARVTSTGTTINSGEWYDLIWKYNTSTNLNEFYLNDISDYSTTKFLGSSNTQDWRFGSSYNLDNYFDGEIKNIIIEENNYFLSSLNDSSTSGNYATGNNGVTLLTEQGKYFDGVSDYIATPEFSLGNDFSISLKVKPIDINTAGQRFAGIGYNPSETGRSAFYFSETTNELIYSQNGGGTVTSSSTFNNNDWVDITFIQNGGNGQLYINGVLESSSNSFIALPTDPIILGAIAETSNYFNGNIKDVLIYQNSNLIYNNTLRPKLGTGAMEFDGVDDYLSLSNYLTTNSDYTISTWYYLESTGDSNYIYEDNNIRFRINTGGISILTWNNAGGGAFKTWSGYSANLNEWTYLTAVYNETTETLKLYENANEISLTPGSGSASSTNVKPLIGVVEGSSGKIDFFDGSLDEFSIYDKVLNQSEITELYNSGTGFNPYTTTGTQITFNNPTNGQWINSTNFDLNVSFSQLINSTYTLNGGSNTTLGTDVNNATASLTGVANVYNNISVYTSDNESSSITFGIDTIAPNISIIGSLTQNEFEVDFSTIFNVTDSFSGLASCTLNATYLENVTNASQYDQVVDCDATTTFGAAGQYLGVLTAVDNAGNTAVLEVNGTIEPFVYINFKDSLGVNVPDYDINIIHPSGYTEEYINTSNPVAVSPFFNGSLDLGEYNITFSKLGYLLQTFQLNISFDSGGDVQNYTVSDSKIIINMLRKDNSQVITGETFIADFIATVGANANTTTGELEVTNVFFLNEEYQVTITSENYITETLIFNFNNQEELEIDAYFIEKNSTDVGTVFVKVVDLGSKPVKGAKVVAQQWDSATSSFITVTQALTGEDGLANMNVILNDENYKFLATYLTSSGESGIEIIESSENGKTIIVVLDSNVAVQNYLFQNLDYTITESYNEETNISTITFQWNNLDGINQEVCINRYRTISNSETLQAEQCTTGSSGELIQAYYINSSNKVTIKGEVKVNGAFYTLKTFSYYPQGSVSNILLDLNLAPFIIPILFLIAIAIGLLMENIYIGSFLLTVASGFSLLLVPTLINGGIVAFFFFVGWMVISAGAKPR